MKPQRILVLLLSVVALSATAAVVNGGGYVAGDGFTLSEALAQARQEHPPGSFRPFWLLALDGAVGALARRGAGPDMATAVADIQRRGGTVYVCEQDLRAAGLDSAELLPGVQAVRGWSDAESGIRNEDGASDAGADDAEQPLSPLWAVNRLCGSRPTPDDSR